MALRVLHVTRDFPPLSKGGISTAVGGMVGALSARGVTCAVVSFDGWRPRARLGSAADASRLQCTTVGHDVAIARLSTPPQVPAAERWADAFRPDVIHVHHDMLWPFAAGIRERVGSPAAVTVHVLHAEQDRLRGVGEPTLSRRAQDLALAQADLVIAPSRAVADRLSVPAVSGSAVGLTSNPAVGPTANPAGGPTANPAGGPTANPAGGPHGTRLRVIGLGVDDTAAARASAAAGPDPHGPVVCAGRLSDMRGTDDLFVAIPRIARAVPSARFVIAGGIPDNPRAEARWRRRLDDAVPPDVRGRVEVTGWLTQDALAEHYARAAALIAPSRFETFGLAVVEAMLFGIPVAVTRAGGLAELVAHDHTGLVCEPRDIDGMVANVCRLLREPATARRLGRAAAQAARGGRLWSNVAPAQIEAYRALTRADGGAAETARRPSR